MKAQAIASTGQNQTVATKVHRRHQYRKVLDGRKQPIRGLWERNGKYIARITVETESGTKELCWKPLEGATTIPQAQGELRRLLTQRESNTLPVLKRTPRFSDYVAGYFQYFDQVIDAKRPATIQKERGALNLWIDHMGGVHLDKITKAKINAFIAKRQADGICGRTVNLDVIALRNVLKRAIDDGWLKTLPTENLRPLKWTAPVRSLVSSGDIDRLCAAAVTPLVNPVTLPGGDVLETGYTPKNGAEFADYIRVMQYTGARRNEALRLKWSDVRWDQKQLVIGSDGLAKNRECRAVDFNPDLEAQLQAMSKRHAPDSQFLFPSPQRGTADISAKTFMETLRLARRISGLPNFNFHDARHFFISHCVMSGIDYMTIARWVGHKDGGVLIGKVYGHLSNEHAQRQAQRLVFGPAVVLERASAV